MHLMAIGREKEEFLAISKAATYETDILIVCFAALGEECYMGLSVKLVTCTRNVYQSLSSFGYRLPL